MIYLESFEFLSGDDEEKVLRELRGKQIYGNEYLLSNIYPFLILRRSQLDRLEFSDITILYGGNGSGKSTALNIIANKLNIPRLSLYNTTNWFERYTENCDFQTIRNSNLKNDDPIAKNILKSSKIITSDDIFNILLQKRKDADKHLENAKAVIDTASSIKWGEMNERFLSLNLEDKNELEQFIIYRKVKKSSVSSYLRKTIGRIEAQFSNGETSMLFLSDQVSKPGLYLFDEPENSLSCGFQMKLADFFQNLAAHAGAQIIIATHSPFLISIPGAKIYNLDEYPAKISNWWQLENMKMYFNLFEKWRDQFLD